MVKSIAYASFIDSFVSLSAMPTNIRAWHQVASEVLLLRQIEVMRRRVLTHFGFQLRLAVVLRRQVLGLGLRACFVGGSDGFVGVDADFFESVCDLGLVLCLFG